MQKLEQISRDVDHLFDQDIPPLLGKMEAAIDAAIDEANRDANATVDRVDQDSNETTHRNERTIVASARCAVDAVERASAWPRVAIFF